MGSTPAILVTKRAVVIRAHSLSQRGLSKSFRYSSWLLQVSFKISYNYFENLYFGHRIIVVDMKKFAYNLESFKFSRPRSNL